MVSGRQRSMPRSAFRLVMAENGPAVASRHGDRRPRPKATLDGQDHRQLLALCQRYSTSLAGRCLGPSRARSRRRVSFDRPILAANKLIGKATR